jgi:D-alanyl-D-alanine dipeptidase
MHFRVLSNQMMRTVRLVLPALAVLDACSVRTGAAPRAITSASTQLVVVITPDWTSTTGTLTRWARSGSAAAWQQIGVATPVVVGRTGLAWGVGFDQSPGEEPRKHEGDGKAPAGIFVLDTAFGFDVRDSLPALRLPYVQLTSGSDCVDDIGSVHYNTIVDKENVARVDWQSAEHMREVWQYKIGLTVGYNKPPIKSRGSCIFLHIWNGPASHTAGCTALDETRLRETLLWLDAARSPLLVQLPAAVYVRLQSEWDLPRLSHLVDHYSARRQLSNVFLGGDRFVGSEYSRFPKLTAHLHLAGDR